MKTASIDYLKQLLKLQNKIGSEELALIYTHVEGFSKNDNLYEIRVFMALGRFIKDITIDVAFACDYAHNNKRLFYKSVDDSDVEQQLTKQLSEILYDGNKDSIVNMKI